MSKRTTAPKVGQVFEILLPQCRFGYFQYVHLHRGLPRFGHLIRVFEGAHSCKVSDVQVLAATKEQFCTFFPLSAAIKEGCCREIGALSVPEYYLQLPLFKDYIDHSVTGERQWWIWDGTHSKRIVALEAEHLDLPLRWIVNLPVLEDRILNGWTARDEIVSGRAR